jgi:sugar phosphate permease
MNEAHRLEARVQLAWLAAAMVLGMVPWFSATVAAPGLTAEWRLSPASIVWVTIAVQLGFVVGTFVSAALLLSDRLRTRYFAASAAFIAGVATLLLVWRDINPAGAIGLRLVTGVALAGVYPPGIKIAAGWWKERRGTAIGILVGALTLGSAAPNLVRVMAATADWRPIIVAAGAASLLSAAIFAFAVREGPFHAPSARFDPRAILLVLRDRGVVLATAGYLGHMWELYAMWSSIGAFWLVMATRYDLAPSSAAGLAFLTIGAGALGCVVAGSVADRVGRPIVTIAAMAVSGACALAIGPSMSVSVAWVALVAMVWGISIVADSAQFSAAVTELAPVQYVGTAITLQTCLGFLLTILTIRAVPVWAERWGWERAYMPLAIGPALGIVAMWALWRAERAQRT